MYLLIDASNSPLRTMETADKAVAMAFLAKCLPLHWIFLREHGKPAREVKPNA